MLWWLYNKKRSHYICLWSPAGKYPWTSISYSNRWYQSWNSIAWNVWYLDECLWWAIKCHHSGSDRQPLKVGNHHVGLEVSAFESVVSGISGVSKISLFLRLPCYRKRELFCLAPSLLSIHKPLPCKSEMLKQISLWLHSIEFHITLFLF